MIARILSSRGGSGGANTINYTFGQTEHKDEHQASECEFLTSNMLAISHPTMSIGVDEETGLPEIKSIPASEADTTPIIEQFEQMAAMNSRVQNPYFHAVLSFDKEDEPKIDNEKMSQIADQFMTDMGFKDCVWVATVHRDTEHTHIHLAACTVQNNQGNTVVDAYNNYDRAMESCRQIEADFGLKEVAMPVDGKRIEGLQNRENAHKLRNIIDVCVHETVNGIASPDPIITTPNREHSPQAGSPLQTFCNKMKEFGVDIGFQFKEGRPTGISYSINESSWSGGKLKGGNRFTLPGLEARGIVYQPSDKDFCEKLAQTSKDNRAFSIYITPVRFIENCKVPDNAEATGNYNNAESKVLACINVSGHYAQRINRAQFKPHYAVSLPDGSLDFFYRTSISRAKVNAQVVNWDGTEALRRKMRRELENLIQFDIQLKRFRLVSRGLAPKNHVDFGDPDQEEELEYDDDGRIVERYVLFGI